MPRTTFTFTLAITLMLVASGMAQTPSGLARQPKLRTKIGKSEPGTVAHMRLSFRNDGKVLAYINGDNHLHFWDVANGKEIPAIKDAHKLGALCLAFSPDGKQLASGGGASDFKLWDAMTGKKVLAAEVPTNCIAFTADGKLLATGGWDGNLTLWDVGNKAKLGDFPKFKTEVIEVAFSPDAKTLVAAGLKEEGLFIFDVAKRAQLAQLRDHKDAVRGIQFHKDGKKFATCSNDRELRIWNLEMQKTEVKAETEDVPYAIAWSPDGKVIATGAFTGVVSLWDANNLRLLAKLPVLTQGVADGLAFSPTEKILAVGTSDGVIRLWELP